MHEYSIVQALMTQVTEQAQRRQARRVVRIRVRIGELSGVDADLLSTAFSTFAQVHERYARTSLEIERVPLTWGCSACTRTFEQGARLRCPDCNLPARLVRGDEIILDQIEMEIDDVH